MILSPGNYHLGIKKKLKLNLKQRAAMKALAKTSRRHQKRIVEWCRDDILFYINMWVWQFNPSKRGTQAVMPFITYPIQERVILARPETHAQWRPYDRGILWCYENDRTMVCEKSRWQGASWMFLIVQDWLCLFHPYVQTLNISRNEAAVDDGTKDSLFWKLRYMHRLLPDWMKGEIDDQKLYFHFFQTDSEATGTASTKRAGVGGRASVIFVDEFPEIERAQEVREKTAMTANCRFFNGTHLGVGTPFQVMCDPRKSPEIVRQRMHWTDNPEQNGGLYEYDPRNPGKPIIHDKTFKYPDLFQFVLDGTPTGGPRPGVRSPWYDKKCVEIGDSRAIAMNLDISPEGAAKQFFDGLKIRNIITESARPPLWEGDIVFDKRGKFERIVEEKDGRLKLWFTPKADGTAPHSKYMVADDVSAGSGATPSCCAGIDAVRSMKVLEYSNPFIEEREFAQLTVAICWFLADEHGHGAKLAWDASGQQGARFEREVLALGYSNIYYNNEDSPDFRIKRSQRPGWFCTPTQKYAAMKDYRNAIYDRVLVDRSETCLLEALLFEYDQKSGEVKHAGETRTNDPSGARKNHGDLVTATAIAWMLAKEFAEGGRQSPKLTENLEPYSLGWLLALEHRERKYEGVY